MKKNLYMILTLGATWGIIEATIGHLLHMLPIGIGWMFWFPIAFFFIHTAYAQTKSFSSVMFTALIAAALKFVDLLFSTRLDIIVNPAVSILIEALSVVLVYYYVLKCDVKKVNVLSILLVGFLWRTLFISFVLCLPQSFTDVASFTSVNSFLNFMFLNNIVNTLFISVGFLAAKVFRKQFVFILDKLGMFINRHVIIKPTLAVSSIALAIAVKMFTK